MCREKHLRTGPRPRRVQQSSRTGCLQFWCWCWFKRGLKRSALFTFDTSVLRITHRNPLQASEKLSKDVRTVFNSPLSELIHRILSTQGLIILKEIALISFFNFTLTDYMWHSVVFRLWNNSAGNSPVQLASICCLRDQGLPKLMGVLDCFKGKVLQK